MKIRTKIQDNGMLYVDTIEFCCRDMEKAYSDGFIIFGEDDEYCNYSKNVNITHRDVYREEVVWDTMPIKYCPFCKSDITVK